LSSIILFSVDIKAKSLIGPNHTGPSKFNYYLLNEYGVLQILQCVEFITVLFGT